ncbi:MAG: RimK family alpha-L-glutamate ligase [Clostridia bacterium]|nr:RimK family alpha-L-glutamate ligase [Clostridia bacterium]
MQGYLIVNGFLRSDKYYGIYELLTKAFHSCGVKLDLITSDRLNSKKDFPKAPDFALFWDKDYYLADSLEKDGVKLFNSALSVLYCDNKILTYKKLTEAGVRVPKTLVAPKTFEGVNYCDLSFVDRAVEQLGLPMIIKEAYGSFGAQVYLADTLNKAKEIVTKIAPKDFVFQQFIETSRGKDLRVNVVGGKVVATILRKNDNDFRSNITLGGDMEPFILDKTQEKLAIKACNALGLDFAGVDVLFGENGEPIICEVNSNPHFKTTLECTGVNLAEHIVKHIINKLC